MLKRSLDLPSRPLGRTGFSARIVGAGDLADRALGLPRCAALLRRAFAAGLNLVDTAPSYEDGFSEEVVGAALSAFVADGHARSELFVIDKIDHLDRPMAEQMEQSLARLGGAPDAFVFHGISTLADWERVLAGPIDEVRSGARFRGVSSHHPEVVEAALASGVCDLVMFPIGPFADPRYEPLVARARDVGVATVCFKTFGAGKLVADSEGYGKPSVRTGLPRLTVEECVRYTLTVDPDVALLGLSSEDEQDAAFAAASNFTPLDPAAVADVRARAALAIEGKGRVWWNPSREA